MCDCVNRLAVLRFLGPLSEFLKQEVHSGAREAAFFITIVLYCWVLNSMWVGTVSLLSMAVSLVPNTMIVTDMPAEGR